MNCLILAAGHGSRLRALGPSKPLVEVCGLPLIEHVIRSAAEAGASGFTVVTGNQADRVEAVLEKLATRYGLPIATVRLADWDRPNGWSVVAGAEKIDGDYLLTMADHLFDPQIVRLLVEAERPRGLRLAVDRRLDNPAVDLDDVTKVEVDEAGAILRIGKQIEHYNAFDTGIFLATPALRTAILDTAAQGKAGSLSDGVQMLAERRQAKTVDIGDAWWIDVDDSAAHVEAEALVRRVTEPPPASS